MSTVADQRPLSSSPKTSTVAKIFYVLSMIAAALGVAIGGLGVVTATGAPQQAAAAAIGCLIIIAAYVFARGIDKLTQ